LENYDITLTINCTLTCEIKNGRISSFHSTQDGSDVIGDGDADVPEQKCLPSKFAGSTYGGKSASVASPQVDGTAYLYRGKLVCCVGSRSTFIL